MHKAWHWMTKTEFDTILAQDEDDLYVPSADGEIRRALKDKALLAKNLAAVGAGGGALEDA